MTSFRRVFFPYVIVIVATTLGFSLKDKNPNGISSSVLPGTQPNVVQSFESHNPLCQTCHQTGNGRTVTIVQDWQGGMMAHSARDPIFYAALAVANKYNNGVGEFCIRCHAPGGWLEGRSTNPNGQLLTGNDLNGIHCDACHRMKDPMIADSTANPRVPGYGNAMMVMQVPRYPKRGPYSDATSSHQVQQDSFYLSGNMCGVCHTVSNPAYAINPTTQPPHAYAPEQRTLSEWKFSWYAQQGEAGTCQACHMKREIGYGCNLPAAPLRTNLAKHDIPGANTFVHDILFDFWGGTVDTARLNVGKQQVIQTLQSAATLEAIAYRRNDTVTAHVRITNLTGHKLPTGYPEGRRIWLHIAGRNANGDTIFQSGAYNFNTADLTRDAQVKIYEMKMGLTQLRATQYGLPAGPSFHLALNDTIFYDNRIPPRGFTNAAFASHLAQPVGYNYADQQYWDVTTYQLPSSVAQVTATLYHQTASKEYIEFLRNENIGNPNDWRHWGDSLFSSWNRRGKSRPIVMNTQTVTVRDSTTGFGILPDQLPVKISLAQNYPNPFNPSTTIAFSLSREAYVTLRVHDLLGREVATLVKGRVSTGEYKILFHAENLPSGMYLYTLTADKQFRATKKLLFMK